MIREPRYNAYGGIDCELDHPVLGWIPYTAALGDDDPFVSSVRAAAMEIGPAPYQAPPPPSAGEVLAAERAGMQVYARAFFAALKLAPFPGHPHMLAAYTQAVNASGDYDDLRIWDERVTIVVRQHPDMEAFRVQFGLTAEKLDALFRLALAIDRGETDLSALIAVI